MPIVTRRITEIKVIEILDAPCNPIALYWLYKSGAWDMWVFSGTQTEGIETAVGESFEQFISELSTVIGRQKFISKSEVPTITLGYEGLSTEKVRGIKGILSSIKVLMLTTAKNVLPPKFMEVNVETGSFKTIETENGFHNLEFTIQLPELFNHDL